MAEWYDSFQTWSWSHPGTASRSERTTEKEIEFSMLGLIATKPVFGVSVKASFKPIPSVTETTLSYRDYLENWNFTCSKFTYDTSHKANNKGADQSVRMCRLVCACVVRKPPKTGFLTSRPFNSCEPSHEKPWFSWMRTTKAQTSLYNCQGRPTPLLITIWGVLWLNFLFYKI